MSVNMQIQDLSSYYYLALVVKGSNSEEISFFAKDSD